MLVMLTGTTVQRTPLGHPPTQASSFCRGSNCCPTPSAPQTARRACCGINFSKFATAPEIQKLQSNPPTHCKYLAGQRILLATCPGPREEPGTAQICFPQKISREIDRGFDCWFFLSLTLTDYPWFSPGAFFSACPHNNLTVLAPGCRWMVCPDLIFNQPHRYYSVRYIDVARRANRSHGGQSRTDHHRMAQ